MVSGPATTATDDLLSGRPITDGLLDPLQMFTDAGLGAMGAAGARAFARGGRSAARPYVANSFTLDTEVEPFS